MPHVKDIAAHTGESQPVPQTIAHETFFLGSKSNQMHDLFILK